MACDLEKIARNLTKVSERQDQFQPLPKMYTRQKIFPLDSYKPMRILFLFFLSNRDFMLKME